MATLVPDKIEIKNNPLRPVVKDTQVEITPSYTGNLVGTATQKDVNDILDSFAGGGGATSLLASAGETISVGQAVILDSTGEIYKADNSAENRVAGIIGIASAVAGGLVTLQYGGEYSQTTTPGTTYYVGTSGAITTTKPNQDGVFMRIIGTGNSDGTKLIINPDASYFELGVI